MIKEEDIGFNYIKSSLENAVDSNVKSKIDLLVRDISGLKDPERLLLCLSIPADPTSNLGTSLCLSGDDFDVNSNIDSSQIYGGSGPNSALHLSNQLEQSQAYTWIMSHLEEDPSTCLRKDEVFEDYRLYCERHHLKVLNTADFGKVMKRAFPNVKPRRLGQRGQSRYCYGGMRKKFEVQPPYLPDLSCDNNSSFKINSSDNIKNDKLDPVLGVSGEVLSDVASIILQYIQQVLGISFSSLYHVAQHLITNRYVNTRSKHAFSLIAYMTNTENSVEKSSNPYNGTNLSLFNDAVQTNSYNKPVNFSETKKREKNPNVSDSRKVKMIKTDDNYGSNNNGNSTGGSSSSSTPTPYPTSSSASDLHGNSLISETNKGKNPQDPAYSSMYSMMMAIQPNGADISSSKSDNSVAMAAAAAIAAQKLNPAKSNSIYSDMSVTRNSQFDHQLVPESDSNSLLTSQPWNGSSPITPRPLEPTIGAKSPYTQTHGINSFNKRNQPPSDAPGSYNPNPPIHFGNLSPSKRYRCEKSSPLTSSNQPSRYIEALGMLSPMPQSGSSVNSYLNVIENDNSSSINAESSLNKIPKSSVSNTSRYLHSAAFTLSLDDDSCYDGDLPRLGASPGPSELFNLMENKSDPYRSDSTCQTPVDICALNSNQNCDDREEDESLNRTLTENDEDAVARQRCGGVDTPPAMSPQNNPSNLLLLQPSSPTEIKLDSNKKSKVTEMIGF